jgi:hypothetical protein
VNANRFDRLARGLTATPSRRGFGRILAGLTLAPLIGLIESAPIAGRSKQRKRKKKGATQRPCRPNCAGKTCGNDGCGRSCGACPSGATCAEGACACPSGEEACQGQCFAVCSSTQVRNPINCACCTSNAELCVPNGPNIKCCSGTCSTLSSVATRAPTKCLGRSSGQPCEFAAQCATGACSSTGFCIFSAP